MKTNIVLLIITIFLSILGIVTTLWDFQHISVFSKSMVIVIFFSLNIINEIIKTHSIEKTWKEKRIKDLLETVDLFKDDFPVSRLRSNVFKLKGSKYKMEYQHNMEEHDDKNITIPLNMGCTGAAWHEQKQIFGVHEEIYGNGKYRIESSEYEKVPQNLQWICSSPVINAKGNVVAVLNFDGTTKTDEKQTEKIKKYCNKLSEKLKDCFS